VTSKRWTFNPFQRSLPVCPECLRPAAIEMGQCCWCGAEVHVPSAYSRWIWFLTLVTVAGLGSVSFSSRHIGTWLLSLLLLSLPVSIVWNYLIPPRIERGEDKSGWPFLFFYVGIFITFFLEWIAWGWLHVGLGAARSELNENWFFFSIPLYWVDSNFLIRSDRWLTDAIGSIMGNSFVWALVAFALYKAVSSILSRSRAIRLNISDKEDNT